MPADLCHLRPMDTPFEMGICIKENLSVFMLQGLELEGLQPGII